MDTDEAEKIAIDALGYVASDSELCANFLGSSGATLQDMRKMAAERVFLASVLEFITLNDAWVIGFCDQFGVGYDRPVMARAVLRGNSDRHWI